MRDHEEVTYFRKEQIQSDSVEAGAINHEKTTMFPIYITSLNKVGLNTKSFWDKTSNKHFSWQTRKKLFFPPLQWIYPHSDPELLRKVCLQNEETIPLFRYVYRDR